MNEEKLIELADSLYAAEVRKLAVRMRQGARSRLTDEELVEFEKTDTELNPWVLKAHTELQLVRRLLHQHESTPAASE